MMVWRPYFALTKQIANRHVYSTSRVPKVFDRHVKKLQRDRAVLDPDQSRVVDYLRDEVADRVVDRLLDIKRRFPVVVDIGSGAGHCYKFVDEDMMDKLIQCEYSEKLLFRDAALPNESKVATERIVLDEEDSQWPFKENSIDAAISSLSLHWVNNLPGALRNISKALKPDAPFIGAMFGGDTLFELRGSFQLAEQERLGGISPHISPFVLNSDVAGLLSSSGFTLTTIDVDEIVVNYPTAFELMMDLQSMGENNAIVERRPALSKEALIAMSAIYKELYGNPDGSVPATFQIIYMIGWKPDSKQPQPLKPSTPQVSLKDLDKVVSEKTPSKK